MYVGTIPNTFHAIVVILCAPGHDVNLVSGFEWTGRNRELKQGLLGICEGQSAHGSTVLQMEHSK